MQGAAPETLYEAAVGHNPQAKELPPKDKDALDRARANWVAFRRAYDGGHKDWIDEANKQEEYYLGEQWDPELKAALEAEKRPALTLNITQAVINTMLGEQLNRRVDIQYRNIGEQGNGLTMTKLAMAICDANQYKYRESEVFGDGMIMDRGYFDIRMCWKDSIDGEIRITSIDPREILLDPDDKSRDPADWKGIIRSYWCSLETVKATWGEEAYDKVRSRAVSGTTYGRDSVQFAQARFGVDDTPTQDPILEDTVLGVRVVDRQYKEYTRVFSLIDPQTRRYRDLPIGTKKAEADAMAATFGTYAVPRSVCKIRWTVSVDEVEISDTWSPYKTFTIAPYFPYFRRGRPIGLMRGLMSPQDQFNKIESQTLHIINSTANSGWTVEQGTLTNMTTDEFTKQASKTGIVVEHVRGTEPPQKIRANEIPTGLDRFSAKTQNLVHEIAGVSQAMMGMVSPEVSGVALEVTERRGDVLINLPLDSLAFTRMLVAKKILELVQDFYTEERVVTVTEGHGAAREQVPMTINQQQPDGTISNDVGSGEYTMVIGTMPDHDTYDDIQFAQILNLRKAGVMIPDYRVVLHSKLDHKEEIAEELKTMAGLGEQTPEQQQQQQQHQEIAMKGALLELEQLQAKADNLRADTELKRAKAQDVPNESERQLQKLEQDIAKKREELSNIMQRHLITNQTKRLTTAQQLVAKAQPSPNQRGN